MPVSIKGMPKNKMVQIVEIHTWMSLKDNIMEYYTCTTEAGDNVEIQMHWIV